MRHAPCGRASMFFLFLVLPGAAAVPSADAASNPSFYLLDLYRTRIDLPTGMLSGVLMGRVRSGIEKGVAMNVETAKARVEGR